MRTEWITIYMQVLDQLKAEIQHYSDENNLFTVLQGTSNSAGNLAMHLVGNIRHFFGAILLENGYIRDREHEFSGRSSRAEILDGITSARQNLIRYFDTADSHSFEEPFPIPFKDQTVTKGYMYLMLLQHFTYHLGQINYHRRTLKP
ncbi:MAG: DUF1572 domain-containing protein [Bacteroidota bacterium]|nr:DUF1572 domain-containing protein [Bacteroidota bacterium]MDX5446868.1 DUF1572 domain-containing protein [Bacteroidota bacterium]